MADDASAWCEGKRKGAQVKEPAESTTAPNSALQPTRIAAVLPAGATLQRVAVRAAERKSRKADLGMATSKIDLDDFTLSIEEGWEDVTADEPGPDSPFTFIHENEIGVLQLSAAIYRGGKKPEVSMETLRDMLLQSASANDLGSPSNVRTSEQPLRTAVADFSHQDDFVRMWYISDGWSFAKATYICAPDDLGPEAEAVERIVTSLRFKPHAAA